MGFGYVFLLRFYLAKIKSLKRWVWNSDQITFLVLSALFSRLYLSLQVRMVSSSRDAGTVEILSFFRLRRWEIIVVMCGDAQIIMTQKYFGKCVWMKILYLAIVVMNVQERRVFKRMPFVEGGWAGRYRVCFCTSLTWIFHLFFMLLKLIMLAVCARCFGSKSLWIFKIVNFSHCRLRCSFRPLYLLWEFETWNRDINLETFHHLKWLLVDWHNIKLFFVSQAMRRLVDAVTPSLWHEFERLCCIYVATLMLSFYFSEMLAKDNASIPSRVCRLGMLVLFVLKTVEMFFRTIFYDIITWCLSAKTRNEGNCIDMTGPLGLRDLMHALNVYLAG